MNYEDLSPFCPGSEEHKALNTVAIGWLNIGHSYPTARPDEEFLKHLLELCRITFMRTRGFHRCEFCNEFQDGPIQIHDGGKTIWLGSAEIRVIGDGKIYASPNMIYHYVNVHHYRPPDEFVNSVITGPQPDSKEFQALVEMYTRRSFSAVLAKQIISSRSGS